MTLEAVKSISPDTHLVRDHGPFQLRRIHPGVALGRTDDGGFGGLGLIDHARLQPGLVVKMHEHRNDEIISYLRSGRLQHVRVMVYPLEVREERDIWPEMAERDRNWTTSSEAAGLVDEPELKSLLAKFKS